MVEKEGLVELCGTNFEAYWKSRHKIPLFTNVTGNAWDPELVS